MVGRNPGVVKKPCLSLQRPDSQHQLTLPTPTLIRTTSIVQRQCEEFIFGDSVTETSSQQQLFYCSQMAADTVEPQKEIVSTHHVDRDRRSALSASKVVDWEHSPFLCSTLHSSATTILLTIKKVLNDRKNWLEEAKLGQRAAWV